MIFSHSRHENLARTVWITFHWRGITSSVSVMSSPSFDSFVDPSTGAAFRRDDDDALARQMLGERLARWPPALEGLDRLVFSAAFSAASSSSLAAASKSSSCSSIWSSSRAFRSERLP